MKKAIIVGGSMAGMLAGNMLFRQGWEVEILERAKEGLEGRGAGIVPQRSLLAALGRAGVAVNPNIGIRVTKRVAYDLEGNALPRINTTNTARRGPYFTICCAMHFRCSTFMRATM